jgi:hypothetical protein
MVQAHYINGWARRDRASVLTSKRTASQALALRTRIVLACAEQGGTMPLTKVAFPYT